MADAAYIKSLMGELDAKVKKAFTPIWDYLLANIRIGRPIDRTRSTNLQAYFYTVTTPAVADKEFSVAHGLGTTPYLAMQVLPLDAVNATVVPLTVTRAADASRIYLSSSTASAPITLLVEG